MAAALWIKPHVLLDEPTNFIDLETTAALKLALKSFQGGVVVVSHNEHFLQDFCASRWCLEQGHLRILKGQEDHTALVKQKLLERCKKPAEEPIASPDDVGKVMSRRKLLELFEEFLNFTLPLEAIQSAADMCVMLAEERQPAHGEEWLAVVVEAVLHVGSYTFHEELGLVWQVCHPSWWLS